MNKDYNEGTPEHYFSVPPNVDSIDTVDALNCIFERAESICLLLGANLEPGSGSRLNDKLMANACWAISGLIGQASILVNGSEHNSTPPANAKGASASMPP